MSSLQDIKLLLMGMTGLAKDALHVYVALMLLFGTALLLRWPLRRGRPLLVVLAAALAGEAWDMADTLHVGMPLQMADNWHDIWNTMFWPLAITALARFTTVLSRR